MAIWKLHGDGKTLGPDEVVAPGERLTWGRTIGLGAQHVVAMFGATFVFPIIMGLNPQLAIMMSGVATLLFLLIVRGRIPSYLGTSAAFVGGVVAIHAAGGTPADVTGAIFISALVLIAAGVFIKFVGASVLTKVLPPVVTGAVVMLIGFNLAPVVASVYWPQDQWVALIVMVVVILMSVGLRGFFGRISIFLGLIFGYILSWILDLATGRITSYNAGTSKVDEHWRVDWTGVKNADWIGFPPQTDVANGIVGWHFPQFSLNFALLVLPAVIALIAENVGHVKAVSEMTGENLDDKMGDAIAADGVGSAVATLVGGSPTTTYAENIGVMASTRVYSTAAYVVAALVAILFGFSPKFGAIISATPGGVLGGITVVLYGMIGLLGAKIWKENKVDFANPLNLVPVAAGIIIAIGNVSIQFTDSFSLSGISLGTIVAVGMYHLARLVAPAEMRSRADGIVAEGTSMIADPTGNESLEYLGLEDDHGLLGRRAEEAGRRPKDDS
ncbi:uracil-xanthine permease family protein [Propionibacteriaceae bacterium G1746]